MSRFECRKMRHLNAHTVEMIDTNTFLIFGIPPYYFFAGIGLVASFGFFIIYIAYLDKPVHKNGMIAFLSFIGLGIGASGFGYLTKICMALYTQSALPNFHELKAGIVFYGGLTSFVSSFILLQKLINKSLDRQIVNTMATAIPLFHAFARIGCFFAGCCYGKKLDTFISVNYIPLGKTEASPIFPVQLVESSVNFTLFFVLLYTLIRYPKKNLLKIYLLLYAVCRFFLEFLRGDDNRGVFGMLSFSQIYSVIIVFSLLIIEVTGKFKGDKKNEIV